VDSANGCAAGNPAYLEGVFEGWSKDIHHIIQATRDDEVAQRDLYDRPPALRQPWTSGKVGDKCGFMFFNRYLSFIFLIFENRVKYFF
jgi:hypothetical protein